MEIRCRACTKAFELPDRGISMREECPHCGADVHTCKNCLRYSEHAYNQCLEPQAERVVDKERNNHCDYFELAHGDGRSAGKTVAKEDYLKQLNSLFK